LFYIKIISNNSNHRNLPVYSHVAFYDLNLLIHNTNLPMYTLVCLNKEKFYFTHRDFHFSQSFELEKKKKKEKINQLTLTFFHQYLRFNLLAFVVNCDAPVCKTSEK